MQWNEAHNSVGTNWGHGPTLAERVPVEPLFDRLISEIPPGSQGLMLQPYWTPGVRSPGQEPVTD